MERRISGLHRRLALRVGAVAAVVAGVVVARGGLAQSATTVVPIADSYVESMTPSGNFGTSSRLVADASPVREIYLRFDLTAVAGPIESARLRMRAANVAEASSPSGGKVAGVDNTTWTEHGITYNNRPTAWRTSVGSIGAVSRNAWVEVPVTSAVTVGGVVTLGIRSVNTDGAFFNSREAGANAPQLVITTGTPPTTTSTTTMSAPALNAVAAACSGGLASSNAGPVSDPALNEVSGIDQSIVNAGIYWVHNDSGDTARVFALNAAGATQRIFTLAGATAIDWEDIAVGPGPDPGVSYLYLADIGDNAVSRTQVVLYRVPEPTVVAGSPVSISGVAALTLKYPDGPHNAEALLVDPSTGEMLIIEKTANGGAARVYRAPAGLGAGSVTTMSVIATIALPTGASNRVTGADVSADGTQVAVRTYGAVLLWNRGVGSSLWSSFATTACSGPVPSEQQGEAVAFHANGRGYVTLSEGSNPTLHNYTAP